MKTYIVTGERVVRTQHAIEAGSPQEAAAKFSVLERMFVIQKVLTVQGEEWVSIGRCEGCAVELFEGDEYGTDPNDLKFCKKCTEALIADEKDACETCHGAGEIEAYRGEPSQGTETIQCPDCK